MFFLTLHKLFLTRNLLTIPCLRLTLFQPLLFIIPCLVEICIVDSFTMDDDPLGRSAALSVDSMVQ